MENTNGYHKFSKRHPLVSWDATNYIPSLIENTKTTLNTVFQLMYDVRKNIRINHILHTYEIF